MKIDGKDAVRTPYTILMERKTQVDKKNKEKGGSWGFVKKGGESLDIPVGEKKKEPTK